MIQQFSNDMESGSEIRIAQVNMARTAIANEDLLYYAGENNIDLALIQEPYTRYGRLVGLEASPNRIILSPGIKQRGGNNILHGAAIVVFNPAISVLARNDLTCDNFSVATITKEDKEINVISAYFKYRVPTETLANTLQDIIRKCKGNIILGADINAFSKRWYSKTTDRRGQLVESLIDEEDLVIMNRTSRQYTFSGPRGKNNIDLTLATRDIS